MLFQSWSKQHWISTQVEHWQDWKHILIRVGKERDDQALLVLGPSLNRFNQMLSAVRPYSIENVVHDLPKLSQLLQTPPHLDSCFENLKNQ